jgi:tripartite-type tricarboxylate transporter receptor subunit TctC
MILLRFLFALLLIFVSDMAGAADYPSKPIRLVVPLSPAGPADTVSRLIARKLTDRFGQSVVVDNRAGGSTIIGTEIVARAVADGYTLLTVTTTHSVNPSIFKILPFDPVRDFAPVTLIEAAPFMLVVHPSMAANTVGEFIALARTKPGQINYASAGNGSSQHLTTELFRAVAKIDLVHVPYKGAGPGFIDLVSGQVQATFTSTVSAMHYVGNRQLRGLAVTSPKRLTIASAMPTVAESGFPGFESSSWVGVMAPSGTPAAVINLLHREVVAALGAKDVAETLASMGADPRGLSPAEFSDYFRSEMQKWAGVIKNSGLRVD